mgnify:CR=1 FL=1
MSAHDLAIEKERYKRPVVPRQDRVCKYCKNNLNLNVVEDEFHFLIVCPLLKEKRDYLFNAVQAECINFERMENTHKLQYLLNGEDDIIRSVAKFCFEGFKLRAEWDQTTLHPPMLV